MKHFLTIAAAMAAALSSCFAADATFSKDCRHVYLASDGKKLIDIDLAAKTWRLTDTGLQSHWSERKSREITPTHRELHPKREIPAEAGVSARKANLSHAGRRRYIM